MEYSITHTTKYVYNAPVAISYSRAYLTPLQAPYQECFEPQLQVSPTPGYMSEPRKDYFGNTVQFFNIRESHGELEVTASSRVQVTPSLPPVLEASQPWEQVRDMLRAPANAETRMAHEFLYPRANPAVEERLIAYAAASFPPGAPLLFAAKDLMTRIFTDFSYDPAATTVSTPVGEVLEAKKGVCQDFAHLQIACFRALGLPAQYVSGYIAPKRQDSGEEYVGSQASHAWLAIFAPGLGWLDLDPTNNMIPSNEHVTLARGRDYDEVSPVRGVIFGGGGQFLSVDVSVKAL